MQFAAHFYDLEDQWAAFPKNEQTGKYPFGLVYVDMFAGFSFHLEGTFTVDAAGRAHRDSTDYLKKTGIYIIRLASNTKLLYAIPDGMLKDLGVKKVPDWLAIYHPANQDRSTVAFKVQYGKHLNSAGAPAKALVYLEDAYQTDPHAAGLIFELVYAYNELKEYDKAIAVLNDALKTDPNNVMLYRETGYAYAHKADYDNAIKYYLKGIDLLPGTQKNDTRAEMAWNLATVYRAQNNAADFKKWGQNAKDWVTPNSQLGKALQNMNF
jgi:tetratricopeptide (TPR) repeat protein